VNNLGEIAAFVVNWNNSEETLKSVHSLRSVFKSQDIFVVDNGSNIEDLSVLSEGLLGENLIRSEENLGYPGGANLAISKILEQGYGKLMSLNNDAEIRSDTVSKLERGLDDESIAMVAPWVVYRDNKKIWYSGGKYYSWLGIARHPGKGSELQDERSGQPLDTDYLCGCCIMFRSSIFKSTGLLDDRFFIYSEDIDHSIKVKSMGFRVCTIPSAIVEHGISVSTGEDSNKHFSQMRSYYYARNQILLIRWSATGMKKIVGIFSQIFLLAPFNFLRMLSEGTLRYWPSYATGVYHGLRNIHGPMR